MRIGGEGGVALGRGHHCEDHPSPRFGFSSFAGCWAGGNPTGRQDLKVCASSFVAWMRARIAVCPGVCFAVLSLDGNDVMYDHGTERILETSAFTPLPSPVQERSAVGGVVRLQVSREVRRAQDEARHRLVRRRDLVGSRHAQGGFDHTPAFQKRTVGCVKRE